MIKEYKTKKIETNRLILDKGTLDDYLKVYEYDFGKLRDINDVFEYEKYDENEVKSWFSCGMEEFYNKAEKKHNFYWIIFLKSNNTPIGDLDACQENLEDNEIEISFNIHPNYWGNGYMPEAIESIINYLFELGYSSIICTYSEGNKKSKRVCEKLEFELYKIEKDARVINGKSIDDCKTIMTKEKWLRNNK